MNKLVLSLEPKELDYIAQALAARPWAEVNALLANIQQQIVSQQQEIQHADAPQRPNGRGQPAELTGDGTSG